jgi:N-acetylmuramoyl-L-alanine amidase
LEIKRNIKTALLITFLFCSLNAVCQTNRKFTIVLDAGHGGKDPGNLNHGFIEKKVALKTALKIGEYLERDKDIRVVHTRKTDVFIELVDRPKVANNIDANLFVSIHCNSVKRQDSYGTETFVMGLSRSDTNMEVAKSENSVILLEKDYKETYKGFDAKNPETLIGLKIMQEDYLNRSVDLASKIEGNFKHKLNRKSRGIKQTPLWVLDAAYMPSVLIELGFLSNYNEGVYLNSDEGQNNMAKAIADAIIAYKKEYFNSIASKDSPKYLSEKESKYERKETLNVVKKKPISEKKGVRIKSLEDTTGVVYKVQIAAGRKKMELKPFNFKGLKNVSVTTANGSFFEYVYGITSDYKIAKQNLEVAKSKGFSSAYLLAFKDGEKISIQEALKL